ncbi:MAG: hypothetical protein Q7U57_12425 [Methylovulum sp.]|nr:hypothetical protein [Methylovulum sp.]
MSNQLEKKNEIPHFNSVQLNLVTFVDVRKANATQTLNDCLYMMDNSVDCKGQGTANLQTTCKQGQTINWIIYAMDMDMLPNGTWPPSVRINNIVFLSEDGEDVADIKVCSEFKVYGPPDKIRSPLTPVYYYWAGTVLSDLNPGVYYYRFIIELDQEGTNKKLYLNTVGKPSLNVIKVSD